MWNMVQKREIGGIDPRSFSNLLKRRRAHSIQLASHKEIVSAHKGGVNSIQVCVLSHLLSFMYVCMYVYFSHIYVAHTHFHGSYMRFNLHICVDLYVCVCVFHTYFVAPMQSKSFYLENLHFFPF